MYFTQNTQLLSDLFNLRRTIVSLNRCTWPILFLRACAHSLGSVQGLPICNRGIFHINWIQFNLMNGLINQSWCFSPITRISSDGDLKAKVRVEKISFFPEWCKCKAALLLVEWCKRKCKAKTWSPLKLLSSKAVRTQPARTPTVSMSFLRLAFVHFHFFAQFHFELSTTLSKTCMCRRRRRIWIFVRPRRWVGASLTTMRTQY